MKTLVLLLAIATLSACEMLRPVAVSDLSNRPAEQSLLAGIRAYDDGNYGQSEKDLDRALSLKLKAAKDVANANKYLAFIYCTSDRVAMCERAFMAARQADPKFELAKNEAGHPLWGPVYRKVAAKNP